MYRKLNSRRGGFTLVEIMIVVAIIALLATIAIPNFLRARKRSQATMVLEDLRLIDNAKDQYAIEHNKAGTASVSWDDVAYYIKATSPLYTRQGNDIFGASYNIGLVDQAPSADSNTYDEFSDIGLSAEFWGAYK